MGRQGNKYEPTVAFIVIPFTKNEEGELEVQDQIHLQDEFELPVTKKIYKTTLKNVEVFIQEFLEAHPDVVSIRLDRISHCNIYNRE